MLEKEDTQRRKIIWIRSATIDLFLDKAAEMEMLKHLALRGNDVILFAGQSKTRFQVVDSFKTNPNIHLILIPLRYVPIITPFLFGFIAFIFLPFFILIERPDFIIVEPGPSIICSIWKRLLYTLKFKVVLDIRSTPVLPKLGYTGFLGSLTRVFSLFLFNISVVIAKKIFDGMTILTALMKKDVCNKFHISPEFIGVWTMGVSTTLFNPESYSEWEMRNKLGLNNKFIIVHHGVFGFHRGIIESIKSIEMLRSKYNDLVFFLLGNGPALSVLKELIQQSKVQDKVIIHDAVDYVDVPKYIAMCSIGIVPLPDLPDWRHQCPQKLLEYLAMKKPVIVTDIPANREVIGRSNCGIYVSSTDPKEIANAITYAYDNRKKLKKWGSQGRVIIEEKYSWKKVAKEFESFLLKGMKGD